MARASVARDLLEERPRGFNRLRALLQEAFPKVNDRALGFMVPNHEEDAATHVVEGAPDSTWPKGGS